jgi:hypothetical protein
MKKYAYESYEEFLKMQRERAAEWYKQNKEYKKAYQKARYEGESLTIKQYEADKLKELEK